MEKTTSGAFADSKPHYELLDGLRGVAALVVMWYHVFEGFATSPIDQGFNHGYLAVDFFFILSGFVIGYAYDDRWKKNLRGRLKRFHVLILDDYGIDMLNASRAEFLYNVAGDRYLRKPVIITTQIDFESRRDPVSDDSPHTGEALCDRLFPEGPAKRIKLTGPSKRGTKDEIRG